MNTHTIGARLHDGTRALWHVEADSHTQAAELVWNEIIQTKPFCRPIVVLACIPGGKA